MRALKIALFAVAATFAVSSAASAADLMINAPESPMMAHTGTNWDGAYIGFVVSGQTVPSALGLGVDFGVNAVQDNILFGGEVSAAWLADSSWTAQAHAKIGALVSDDLAFYGLVGFGTHSANGAFIPLGVGIEAAVAQDLTVKAEYQYNWDLDNAAQSAHVFKVGLNWHF